MKKLKLIKPGSETAGITNWDIEAVNEKVIVCDKCFAASCWQGVFMCEESRNAGTVEKTINELLKLNIEHQSFFLK